MDALSGLSLWGCTSHALIGMEWNGMEWNGMDTCTYYDYHWLNHDIFQWCKQNMTSRPITGDTYLTLLYHTDVSDGLDIQSMAGLKTFVQWVDEHCASTQVRLTASIVILSASLYFSKRGAYWDRLCSDVVGRWLVGWLVGWLSHACTVAKRCILGL